MANQRALLVGIDNYPDPYNNLNSCVADTKCFATLLRDVYGFRAENIKYLHDRKATKSAVCSALDGFLFRDAHPGDRLVFFQSSHGYKMLKNHVDTEVLCMYDEFFEDTELVKLSGSIPPGTLTCIIDACHSGGMEKQFFDGRLITARAKVFHPSPEKMWKDTQRLAQVSGYKAFGRAATSDAGAAVKLFSSAAFSGNSIPKAKAGEADTQLNGILAAACRADETAAAGTDATEGLSAFTWALTNEVRAGGNLLAARDLGQRVTQRLKSRNLRQTPVFEAPMAHGGWLDQTLVNFTSTSSPDDSFPSFVRALGITH